MISDCRRHPPFSRKIMSHRKEKIQEQIHRLVSDLLIRDIKDPRIGFATVTSVELNGDWTQAMIGISVLGEPRDMRKTLEGLNSATAYIQHRVGKGLGIRSTPRISFFLDSSIADGVRMVGLLNKLEVTESDGRESNDDPDGTDDEQPEG